MHEKLINMVKYTGKNNVYYKNLFSSAGIICDDIKTENDFLCIPTSNKDSYQENYSFVVSEPYSIYPHIDKLITRNTSGSSGKCLKVYWDRNDDIKSMFPIWVWRYKQYGISVTSKLVSFFTTTYKLNRLIETDDIWYNETKKILSLCKINLNNDKIAKYYHEIYSFSPEWMQLQPSIAIILGEYINENKMKPLNSLKYIELTGEYLTSNSYKLIKKFFDVKLTNNYGCIETNYISIECEYNNMHINDKNVYVEILNNEIPIEKGEEGDIYVSSLNNHAMPFIRYKTGDRGFIKKENDCLCGNKSPILVISSGRISEYILLKNGNKINNYIFLYTIEHINEYMGNPIKQFKIIQTQIEEFEVYLSLKDHFANWKEAVKNAFLQNIKEESIKNCNWKFIFVDKIYPAVNTGKLSFFQNNLYS